MTDAERPGGSRRWTPAWVLHPFFFALFPVAFLYRENVDEAPWEDAARAGVVVFAGVALLLALTWLLFRDLRRAGIVTSGVALLLLSYGHVFDVLAGTPLGRDAVLLAAWALVAGGIVWGALRIGSARRELTGILNVVGALLLVTTLLPIAVEQVQRGVGDGTARAGVVESRTPPEGPSGARKPDIFYIVPDRYPGAVTLREGLGFDNGPFLRSLEEKGFHVVDEARTNYPKTIFSLAATLNMEYLPSEVDGTGAAHGMLEENAVVEFLRDQGYRWVYFPGTHDPTRMDQRADVTFRYDESSEFARHLYRTSIAYPVVRRAGMFEALHPRRGFRNRVLFQFENIPRAQSLEGPVFAMAHIELPHDPFVFHGDGNEKSEEEEDEDSFEENFLDHVRYANSRLDTLLDKLLEGPESEHPIILLQSDEGPHMRLGRGLSWDEVPAEHLDWSMRILSAYYLPGVDEETVLHEGLSPVNSFRVILNAYFDADLPLLPDEYHGWRGLYEFFPLTERIHGAD